MTRTFRSAHMFPSVGVMLAWLSATVPGDVMTAAEQAEAQPTTATQPIANPRATAREQALASRLQVANDAAATLFKGLRSAGTKVGGAMAARPRSLGGGSAGAGGPAFARPGPELAPAASARLAAGGQPHVLGVNGTWPEAGHVFTPGSYLVIKGGGFGTAPGQVHLLGPFPQRPAFRIDSWDDEVIYAMLDPQVSGLRDQPDVVLVVAPVGAKAVHVPNVRFEAALEVVKLDSTPTDWSVVKPGAGSGWERKVDSPAGGRSLSVLRKEYAERLNVRPPGVDTLVFQQLDPDFTGAKVQLWHGRTHNDPEHCEGSSGNEGFSGTYGVTWVEDDLDVSWGVWTCHISPVLSLPSRDQNQSFYQLDLYVIGPRGVRPTVQRATDVMGPPEPGISRNGADFRNFPTDTFESCQQECLGDRRCKAVSFVRPGLQEPSGRCWMKEVVPNKSQYTGVTSSVRQIR